MDSSVKENTNWDDGGYLENLTDDKEFKNYCHLLENVRNVVKNKNMYNSIDLYQLNIDIWKNFRFKNLFSLHIMCGPVSLLPIKIRNTWDKHIITARSLEYDDTVYDAENMARQLEVWYIEHIVRYNCDILSPEIFTLFQDMLGDMVLQDLGYDWLICPDDFNENRHGMFIVEDGPHFRDDKTDFPIRFAGNFIDFKFQLPVFCPYVLAVPSDNGKMKFRGNFKV